MIALLHLKGGMGTVRQRRAAGNRPQRRIALDRFLRRQQRLHLPRVACDILRLTDIDADFSIPDAHVGNEARG